MFGRPAKDCAMTSWGAPGWFLSTLPDTQYLWTVPVLAEWEGTAGFGNTVDSDDGDHWWRFDGDWYCSDEGGGGGRTIRTSIQIRTVIPRRLRDASAR